MHAKQECSITLSASRMNTVLKYVIGLDLLNCHAKFRGDTRAVLKTRGATVTGCAPVVSFCCKGLY